jgi:hypothetical protein
VASRLTVRAAHFINENSAGLDRSISLPTVILSVVEKPVLSGAEGTPTLPNLTMPPWGILTKPFVQKLPIAARATPETQNNSHKRHPEA